MPRAIGIICARAATAAAITVSENLQVKGSLLERTNKQFRQAERLAAMESWRLELPSGHIELSDQVYAIHGLDIDDMPLIERALDFYPDEDRQRIQSAIAHTAATGDGFDIQSGLKVSNTAMASFRVTGNEFYPEWNNSIAPGTPKSVAVTAAAALAVSFRPRPELTQR